MAGRGQKRWCTSKGATLSVQGKALLRGIVKFCCVNTPTGPIQANNRQSLNSSWEEKSIIDYTS